ncbi:MAG: hypothetical protein WC668_01080 [Patescibacteria group bacterium]|jgi:hypothetical protein
MSEDCHPSPDETAYEPLPEPPKKAEEEEIVVVFEYTEKASPAAYCGTRFMRSFYSEQQLKEFQRAMEADDDLGEKIYKIGVTRKEGERLCDEALTTERMVDIALARSNGNQFILEMELMKMALAKTLPSE